MPRGNTIHIPAGTYSGSILAKLVGVSKDTIVRWRGLGYLPYEMIPAGKLNVYAYKTEALDIARTLKKGSGTLSHRVEEDAA